MLLLFQLKPESSYFNMILTPTVAGVTYLGLFTASSLITKIKTLHQFILQKQTEFDHEQICDYNKIDSDKSRTSLFYGVKYLLSN
jgi:hypothetical protein